MLIWYNARMSKEVKKPSNYDNVVAVLVDKLGKKPTDIKPESRIVEDLGADSLDVVEMLMSLEDDYGVTIPDEEASKIKTVAQLAGYLDAQE